METNELTTGHCIITLQRAKLSMTRRPREGVDRQTTRMDTSGMRLRIRLGMSLVMRWPIIRHRTIGVDDRSVHVYMWK